MTINFYLKKHIKEAISSLNKKENPQSSITTELVLIISSSFKKALFWPKAYTYDY